MLERNLKEKYKKFHVPDSWPLMNTCKAWPAEKTVRRGHCPLFRKPSFGSILILKKKNMGESKI